MHEAHVRAFGEWAVKQMLGRYDTLVAFVESCTIAYLLGDYEFGNHLKRESFERFFETLPPGEGERLESFTVGPYAIEDR